MTSKFVICCGMATIHLRYEELFCQFYYDYTGWYKWLWALHVCCCEQTVYITEHISFLQELVLGFERADVQKFVQIEYGIVQYSSYL